MAISNSAREDFGQYRVVVENNIGSDSATICLTVADGPDPPRFPIVENVLDEAVILSWKTPEVDGGAMITKYVFRILKSKRMNYNIGSVTKYVKNISRKFGLNLFSYIVERREVTGDNGNNVQNHVTLI